MKDTILLAEPLEAWRNQVVEALKLSRDGDLLALSTLALAHTSLIEDCFLAGEPVTADARGRALHSLLRWAVDKLRPGGQHSWTLPAWRAYNILASFYLQGMRASALAEALAIAEQTLYQWRPQAIAALAHLLREEVETPRDTQAQTLCPGRPLCPSSARGAATYAHYGRVSAFDPRDVTPPTGDDVAGAYPGVGHSSVARGASARRHR
jgi:hypothetical protein